MRRLTVRPSHRKNPRNSTVGQSLLRDADRIRLVRLLACEHFPTDPDHLIGERDHRDLPVPADLDLAEPRAEREKRAKIIHAEGEFLASEKLAKAAGVIAEEPLAVTLRYLQTATEIASEKNSTLIFPLPIDLLSTLMAKRET